MLVLPVESVAQLGAGEVMVEVSESNVIPTPVVIEPQPPADHRCRMAQLAHIVATELPRIELPVTHHFSKGVYGRELLHFAGTVLIGKIHKYQNMLVMLAGDATLIDGEKRQRVQAPQVWVTPPGVQRAAYAHTDCIWMSVHGTDETDLDKIEAEFIAQDALDYEQFLLQQSKGA